MIEKPVRRRTNQRAAVLEELQKLCSHPTADELHQVVRRRLPKISLATVYRNLEVLCADGLAQKLEMPGHQKRFDGNTKNHHHIRCIECGRVEDVDIDPVPEIEQTMADRSKYKLLSHRLEFIGLCPACMADNSAATSF